MDLGLNSCGKTSEKLSSGASARKPADAKNAKAHLIQTLFVGAEAPTS
jgi:hypothetical protein